MKAVNISTPPHRLSSPHLAGPDSPVRSDKEELREKARQQNAERRKLLLQQKPAVCTMAEKKAYLEQNGVEASGGFFAANTELSADKIDFSFAPLTSEDYSFAVKNCE